MLKSVYYMDYKFRDELIKIAMFCGETEITNFVRTFDDIASLFAKYSPDVQALLSAATFTTDYSDRIEALSLARDEP